MRLIDSQISSLCRGTVPQEMRSLYSRIGVDLPATIAPMIEPFDVALVNPASIDIRIGTSLKQMIKLQIADYSDYEEKGYTAATFEDIDLSEFTQSSPYWIYPGDRILVPSLETFNLPSFLTGTFKLKSSRAREFYQHLLAGFADPGWNGSKLTMELINLSHSPLPIYPGLKIGQVVFDLTFGIPVADYSVTGRYNGDVVAAESKG